MEYAGNLNLKQYINNYKAQILFIDEKIIENIIKQICLALKEIHNKEIIHRDLTPDNIFINENNQIKIGDFGVSKKLNTKKYAKTKTGKYHYNAPEVEAGIKYDYKADLYSLGCIIYELFTLNEYYIDKLYNKTTKINTDNFDHKWQVLIDSLLNIKPEERPTIEDIFKKYIKQNIIILTVNIDKNDINKEIYFLDNMDKHENIKEMNKSNTELYINNIKKEYNKFFIPEKEGTYDIKLIINSCIKDCKYMFFYCKNLIKVDLSLFETKEVTNMNGMFYECSNLKEIDLKNLDTKKVVNMSYLFNHCHNLKKLDLASFNTENVKDMNSMFCNCKNIENIVLTSFNTQNVNDMECMFADCHNLKNIDLNSFDVNNVDDLSSMFRNCHNLISIDLSKFLNKDECNTYNIFGGCEKLNHIKINKNLKNKMIKDNPNYKDDIFNKQGITIENLNDCIII